MFRLTKKKKSPLFDLGHRVANVIMSFDEAKQSNFQLKWKIYSLISCLSFKRCHQLTVNVNLQRLHFEKKESLSIWAVFLILSLQIIAICIVECGFIA